MTEQNFFEFIRLKSTIILICLYSFSLAALAVIVFFVMTGGSPYPYTDDWGLLPIVSGSDHLSLSWLWEQHVDHRIPLPKALWFWSLRASGLDFRSGMILNALFAFLATISLLLAMRLYRGSLSLGDFVIPFVLLNPAYNIFYWSFYLQFMSSIALCLVAIALGIAHFSTSHRGYALAAAAVLFCLTGTGMNGTVIATILASTLIVALLRDYTKLTRWDLILATAIAFFTLIVAGYIIATWSPSSASGLGATDLATVIKKALEPFMTLSAPRPWVASVLATSHYLAFGLVLSAMAAFFLGVTTMRHVSGVNIYLVGSLLCGWLTIAAIAVGRAEFWSPGLEYHYGYFPVIMVMVAWIILSVGRSKSIVRLSSLALLLLFGSMYFKGVVWGLNNSNVRGAQLAAIRQDLAKGVELKTIVGNNILVFWWKNDQESIDLITENMKLLQNNQFKKTD